MDYYKKYNKYKRKYTDYKKFTKKQEKNGEIQFILFGDILTGHNVWFRKMNNKKINFVKKLKNLGKVIILKPNYINFMNYSKMSEGPSSYYKSGNKNINFTIEDLQYEKYSEWVYRQIDKNIKYIAIGLDQGCHFAKHFCNQYKEQCMALYILIDRNLTKNSYEKAFHSENNYNFIKNIVGDDYEKYIIENITNDTIKDLLNKIKMLDDNEKYIQLLNGICKGIIRSQYEKIQKMQVKTIVFSDANTLTPEKLNENIQFNINSDDKIKYFYVIDDAPYLIHGKYAGNIYNSIYCLYKNI